MSISFSKLHQRQEVIAMIRHSENEQRLSHNHSNQDINKNLTHLNVDQKNLGYIGTIEAYDKRIAQIDKHNSNRRKDRVTCFELLIPFPNVAKERWAECQELILNFLHWTFGANLINSWTHYDELHPYFCDGQILSSRPHIHAFITPELEGQLNGKKFSSRARMIKLNRELDEEFMDKMGVHFLTGGEQRKKTVEELKIESYKSLTQELAKKDKEIQERMEKIEQLDNFDEMARLYKQIYDEEFERSRARAKQKSR